MSRSSSRAGIPGPANSGIREVTIREVIVRGVVVGRIVCRLYPTPFRLGRSVTLSPVDTINLDRLLEAGLPRRMQP